MMTISEIAERFAKSLDAEDYQTAQSLLSNACEYVCRGRVFVGPDAIIESYKGTGDSAKLALDKIEYESRITVLSQRSARIQFIDRLIAGDERFSFRCEQLVEVDSSGRISRIEQIDLPGERPALCEFFDRHGIEDPATDQSA